MVLSLSTFWGVALPTMLTGLVLLRALQKARGKTAVVVPIPLPISNRK